MPLIVGAVTLVMVPATTLAVAVEVALALRVPAFLAVTRTVIGLPTSPATGVYVEAVAPATSTPSATHWRAVLTSAGFQVPAPAVSVTPTFAVPLIVGTVTLVIVPATTAAVATSSRWRCRSWAWRP